MPEISVILPVYNGEKYVEQTIRSVLGQTFKDFELLIINDGSRDRTLDILQSIQDPRIQIFSYANAGPSASRNRGIAQAKGDFIAFIDADDLWTSDKLECQLKALLDNPTVAVAYSLVDFIDPEGRHICRGSHVALSGNIYDRLLISNFIDCGSNVLVRKTAFEVIGIFDESLKFAEDWDLYLRLASRFSFIAVSKPQIFYRLSSGSLTTDLVTMEPVGRRVIRQAFCHAPAPLRHLKKASLANFYNYLFRRSREVASDKEADRLAARSLLYSLLYGKPAIQGSVRVVLKEVLDLAVRGWCPFLRDFQKPDRK